LVHEKKTPAARHSPHHDRRHYREKKKKKRGRDRREAAFFFSEDHPLRATIRRKSGPGNPGHKKGTHLPIRGKGKKKRGDGGTATSAIKTGDVFTLA